MRYKNTILIASVLLLLAGVGFSQPLIAPKGIVNAAASLTPAGLPGGSIARGSLFSVFGSRLGPATGVSASAFPLGTTLSGVSMKITQGSVSVDAIPVFVNSTQINAIMPSNAPLGTSSMVITYNNAAGPPAPVQIVNSAVGIFSVPGGGIGPGVFLNFVTQENQPVNAPGVTAKRGQVITMYATGLGPVPYSDAMPASAGNLLTPVEIFVGGKLANKLYTGRAPGIAAEDQMVFEIPADAPLGCWVPVQVRTEGQVVSNSVSMAISAGGEACSESANVLAKPLISGSKTGIVALYRVDQQHGRGRTKYDDVLDFGAVTLRQDLGGAFAFNPLFSLPPAGSCTVYAGSIDFFGGNNPLLTAPSGKYLSGGANFSLITPKGARAIAGPKVGPVNITTLGGNFPGTYAPRRTPVLDSGTAFQLNGDGGADVGPIRASFSVSAALTWTNRNQIADVDRSQPLTINWTGAPAGQTVLIIGSNSDISLNSNVMFVCTAEAAAGTFAVPSQILQALPASRASLIQSKGILYVGNAPLGNPSTFTATGLDLGVVMPILLSGKDLNFK
ncbi:MAG: hypothetical protein ABI822_25855 [Bryobacteraceae bacterium]